MWQCYIHLWQYSCFVQKNSAYIFSSQKVILWMKLSPPFDWWLNHSWYLGKVWRLLTSMYFWSGCMFIGAGGFLPFYSRTTLQALLFCLKVREVIHLPSRIFDIVWKHKEVFDNYHKGNIINVNNKQYNHLHRNNLLSII